MPVPLVGAERVAKALIGWGRQARERGLIHRRPSSTASRASSSTTGRRAVWVAGFEIADGVVVAVRSVLNPDKLGHVPAPPA